MAAVSKTNAARLLDRFHVPYRLLPYEVSDEHIDAVGVAERVGLRPQAVFKTLVARGDLHGHCMAVIPAPATLDLKALARASGDRRVELVALRDVTPLTGYIRGGVTALAAKKPFPVFLDRSALLQPEIAVSAGRRGCQLVLRPSDYARVTQASILALALAEPDAPSRV